MPLLLRLVRCDMKFYGEPFMLVRDKTSKRVKKVLFTFDEKGEYETTDPALIERLKPHFRHEEDIPQEEETHEETKTICCKQCGLTFENKGLLLAHIKKEHKKEVKPDAGAD